MDRRVLSLESAGVAHAMFAHVFVLCSIAAGAHHCTRLRRRDPRRLLRAPQGHAGNYHVRYKIGGVFTGVIIAKRASQVGSIEIIRQPAITGEAVMVGNQLATPPRVRPRTPAPACARSARAFRPASCLAPAWLPPFLVAAPSVPPCPLV